MKRIRNFLALVSLSLGAWMSLASASTNAIAPTASLVKSYRNASLVQLMKSPALAQLPQGNEIESGAHSISEVWNAELLISKGYAQKEDDEKMVRCADGSWIGIYTKGAGSLLYEAQVVKFGQDGSVKWETPVQMGHNTTARCLTEDGAGNIYVAGTTVDKDGNTHVYSAHLDANGKIIASKALPAEGNVEEVNAIYAIGDGAMVVYTIYQRWEDIDINFVNINSSGEETGRITCNAQYGPNQVLKSGSNIVAITNAGIYGVDLSSMKAISAMTNIPMYSGYAEGSNLYVIYRTNGSINVRAYDMLKNPFTEVWTCLTNVDETYYMCYVYKMDNGNVYATVKRDDYMDFVIIDPTGKLVKKQVNINLGDEAAKGGFCYDFNIGSDGNYIFTGQSNDFRIYVSKVSPEGKNIYCKFYVFNASEGCVYCYMRENQSEFVGDNLAICSFVRKRDINKGYYPYFVMLNTSNDNPTEEWVDIFQPGEVPVNTITSVAIDGSGNTYATATINTTPYLLKYDTEGKILWEREIAAPDAKTLEIYKVVTLHDGTPIVSGFISKEGTEGWDEPEIPLWAYNPDGQLLWNKSVVDFDKYSYPRVNAIAVDKNDNIYLASNAYTPTMSATQVVVTKFDASGNLLWDNPYTYPLGTIFCENMNIGDDETINISGYAYGDDWKSRAALLKITSAGKEVFLSTGYNDSETGKEFFNAYSDKDGKTFACGYDQEMGYAIIAAFDANGKAIWEQSYPDRSGVFYNIGPSSDNIVVSGSAINQGLKCAVGIVKCFDKNGGEKWEKQYENGSTYFLYSDPSDILTCIGFTQNQDGSISELLVRYDADGVEKGYFKGARITCKADKFNISGVASDNGKIAVSGYYALDRVVSIGLVGVYSDGQSYIGSVCVDNQIDLEVVDGKYIEVRSDGVKEMQLYDLNGRLLSKTQGNVLSCQDLEKGIFVLRVKINDTYSAVKIRL